MSAVSTIQFTQEQARALTGVSVETVRHWRRTIPYLAAKSGKATRFTFADLVGLAAISLMVSSLGVRVTALSDGVDALFRLLGAMNPTSLNDSTILITTSNACVFEPNSDLNLESNPTLLIALSPLVEIIQRQMLPITPQVQQLELPFPPMAVRGRV